MKKAWIVFCEESSYMPSEGHCYNRIFFGRQKFQVESCYGWLRTGQGEFPKWKALCFALCKSRSTANGASVLGGEPACV